MRSHIKTHLILAILYTAEKVSSTTCKLRNIFQLSNGKWQSIGESTRVQAVLQTFTEVTCLLTHDIPKHEYSLKFVAVSTDGGITHSNEKLVILAHSDCFSCNADKGCTRTEVSLYL